MQTKDSGLFMYAARPAEVAKNVYSDQHYFGTLAELNTHECLQIGTHGNRTSMKVLRFADKSQAQLGIRLSSGNKCHVDIDINMTADQLQTLACALLDAAHELRTVPATHEQVAA